MNKHSLLNRYGLAFAVALMAITFAEAQVFIPNNNLIANGDFMSRDQQQRPLRWYSGTGLQTAVINGAEHHNPHKDDQSLKVSDTSTISGVLERSEKHLADPGTTYMAAAWVKVKKDNPGVFKMEFWDQNNKVTGSTIAAPTSGTDWQKLEISLKAPEKSTHVTVSISTTAKETGLAYWDDVTLVYDDEYKPELKRGVRELFMDDYRIARMTDVQRVVNPGVKSKVIMNPDKPWEGTSAYIYGTVLKDEPAGTGYRMWYTAYMDKDYFLCYATSKDGIHWVKPHLGIYEYKGSKQNNICRFGGGTLVYDPKDKDPQKRYKLMRFDSGDKDKSRFGYQIYFSPDGLNWHEGSSKPVLPYGDVSNVAYDKDKELFIATTKQRMLVSNTSVTPGKMDRMAFVSVSKDFINWTAPASPGSLWTLAVEGDPNDDMDVMSRGGIESNVYGMPVYPYQGAYIGFPWMFDITTYNNGVFASAGDGPIQPQVAFSRDLRHWARPVRTPVIPLGKAGAWDDGTLYTCSTMQVSDREMSVYYGAMNLPHGGSATGLIQYARIGKATWRRDGMESLYNAGDDQGGITTKDIVFSGKQLKINTKLNAGGSLKIEVLDADDKPISGFTHAQSKAIIGDQYQATAIWGTNSDLSKLAGKTVKLRFYLKGGNLYSYWFE